MKVLITASNGTIGSRVVKLLKQKPSIDIFEACRQPKHTGQVAFDFDNENLMLAALQNVDKAILITPASPHELETGVRFVQLAKQAGLKHLVFMSIHQVESEPNIPHFASKIAIQKELETSGLKWTTVAPNNFYQNDYFFEKAILNQGVYPQPFGSVGLSRVDADDIAQCLVNALFREELAGQIYPAIGPEALTADQVAKVYEKHLGFAVRYAGDDLNIWQEQNKEFIPDWLLSDWKKMYAFFQREGLKATVADYIQQEKILGHAPKSFETFVKETVQNWKK